jgi:predicted GNAT family acetyltransferase
MYVTRHDDADGFLEAAAPIAARGEASASFFIGWAHSLKRTPPPPDERVYFATCRGDGAFGVAIQRDVGPVLVGRSDPAAGAAFADDLAADFPALCGVMGDPATAEAFAERWRTLTGRASALRVRLRQHVLREVAAVPAAPGVPRVATEDDLAWLIERQIAFIAETGVHDAPARVVATMPKRVERGDFWIWDDGAAVALVGFNDAAPAFARVAPVYTVPDRRGRGYATALVAAVARELLRRGKARLFLTTDVANPTSNAIYARIGFRPESDDCALDFVDARD